MKRLYFVCPWNGKKEKSWSGTHNGLRKHLAENFNIIDIDTGLDKTGLKELVFKIIIKSYKIAHGSFDDMGVLRMKLVESKVERIINKNKYPCIQFEECPSISSDRSYIYQDLHVGYVKKMLDEMPDIFAISGFQHLSAKAIYQREKFQRQYYLNAKGIFTMGKWLANELVNNYGLPSEKVFPVGGGCNIDVDSIDYSRKTGNKILFIGRDFERKNGNLVVEAFKLAKKTRENLELFIAGPKVLDINVEGIHFLGDVSYDGLIEYYNKCDIFCMPSKFEAYGLVFVEALIFGLPCIGRNAYEMPYFIEEGETGYLLEHESPVELCELMLQLISNGQIKENVRKKRDWYIQEYSWTSVSKRIASIIEKDDAIE